MTECFRALQNETIEIPPNDNRTRRSLTPKGKIIKTQITQECYWSSGLCLSWGIPFGIVLGATGHSCFRIWTNYIRPLVPLRFRALTVTVNTRERSASRSSFL